MARAQFYCLVGGVLAPGKLLPSPKETVADPQSKHLLFGWWSSMPLLTGPRWRLAGLHGCSQQLYMRCAGFFGCVDFCVVPVVT